MDSGHIEVDKQIKRLENRLAKEYKQAERELKKKTKQFMSSFKAKDKAKKKMVASGEITKKEWLDWRKGQIFMSDLLQKKTNIMAQHLSNANLQATNVINGQLAGVYAKQYNYAFYQLEKKLGINTTFTLHDTHSVERLAKKNPKLLPKKKLDTAKDVAWSRRKINNAIMQGIMQGESLDKIADRMTSVAEMSWSTAVRTARTAMTGAQNAGRLDSLSEAENMGINVHKQWMATLDEHTRESHAEIDGESVPVNEPFSNGLMYPADPDGDPAEVYNCRCTMVGDLQDYQSDYERYDNIEGEPIENMTYKEWAAAKQAQESGDKMAAAQAKVDAIQNKIEAKGADKVFSNIWKEDVTYADYEAKKGAIPAKKQYYNDEIQKYADMLANDPNAPMWVSDKLDNLIVNMENLEEFEKFGAEYSKLFEELAEAQKEVDALLPSDVITQARRDNAIWAKSPEAADKALRDMTGEAWRAASKAERDAAFDYTVSYHKYNEPLRGIEYGTNAYKGVGNTDLNASYANNGRRLNALTKFIDRCRLKKDQWFQRGCDFRGMDKFFNCDINLLRYGTEEELKKALLGKNVTEYGFMSMGSSKGRGFSGDIILNIFVPKGTKAVYVEPFSGYGLGGKSKWDGIAKQSMFGGELETLLQQNTRFKIVKIERRGSTIFMDLDVISQGKPQLWKGK